MLGVHLRSMLFILYLLMVGMVPLAILWGQMGAIAGLVLCSSFVLFIRISGAERIARRMGAQFLPKAQAPHIYATIEEYCRRLNMPVPKIAVIDSYAINFAVFGFSHTGAWLAISKGAIEKLERSEISALLALELVYLKGGEVLCGTWLSQFLSALDRLAALGRRPDRYRQRTFQHWFRKLMIWPLGLFPILILRPRRDGNKWDLQSIKISRKPRALAEGLRLMQAYRDRVPLCSPFSTRHLFLASPPSADLVENIFFEGGELPVRIRALESLNTLVTLS
ncbi:MAG: hypothetical protein HY537_13650 [Deltaproteobacteria bacterium]|nr:hypothetical protein [Deltaproteobacteria bacterium]